MSIRRMITFSERGSELLTEATAGARERAAGEYIGAVLAQRRKAWAGAIRQLMESGYTLPEIREYVRDCHRTGSSFLDMVKWAGGASEALWFYQLVLEYDAGNKALIAALDADASR